MATFQVPQFVDQKSKIVGPFTLKQFLYLVVAAGISLFSFYTFTFFLWIVITGFVGGIALALAFVKIHGRELPMVLVSALHFVWSPRTYTWKREVMKTESIDTSSLERLQALRQRAEVQEKLRALKTFIMTRAKRTKEQIHAEQERPRYQTVERITGEEEVAKKIDY